MRITNNMLTANLLRNLSAAQGRMDDLQNQLSSGHRIVRPSDDPVGIENALRLKSTISKVDQWSKNASQALAYMNTTSDVLGDMTSMLQRVRELAVQAANGTNNAASRQAIKDEVDQIAEQLRVLANTQVGNKYIFAGTKTDTEPMPTIDPSSWAGNDQAVKVEVGNGLTIAISVNADTLFLHPVTSTQSGASPSGLFDSLKTLSAALANDDTAGIAGSLADIDGNIDNILAHQADLGARINRLDSLNSQLQNTSVNLQQNLADIQDADMAKTITDFTNQQNVYRAALAVGAKIIQPSLVDFMS